MRLLFVTQYGESAASSRTRVFQYVPFLKEHGHHCRIVSVVKDKHIFGSQLSVETNSVRKMFYYVFVVWRTLVCGVQVVSHGRNSDVIFIQKVIFPSFLRRAIKCLRAVVIFDFDDAIFTTEVQERNWLTRYKLHRNEIGVPAMLKISKLAIVENEYNASFAKNHVKNIGIITGPIDTLFYNPRQGKMAIKNESRVVLGWIGSATTLPYLLEICDILEKIGRKYSNVYLNVVGAKKIHLREMEVTSDSWSIETEVDKLMKFDIGLMPVPDNAWTRGKGGYKLLQYMSMGLPVIASPVGINIDIVSHGQDGFLASSGKEWENFLRILIENRTLRECMGERGRKKIEDKYSLQRSQLVLEELIIRTAVN